MISSYSSFEYFEIQREDSCYVPASTLMQVNSHMLSCSLLVPLYLLGNVFLSQEVDRVTFER